MLLELFRTRIREQLPDAEFWAVCEERVEGPGIRWFGRVPLEELAELYRKAWVFCLPSTYEGFGVPYIEAMASGTPVVATPNVGAREVTREGRAGLIVEDAGLGNALVRLLQDEPERRRLREAGLERARDFAWDHVCSSYEALYVGKSVAEMRATALMSPVSQP
jgi:glycosyltransferase involved in cell wall biosynthesis